jgi:hypothetical protein
MSTRNDPALSQTGVLGKALATTQKWSPTRGTNIMDLYSSPGTVLADGFETATNMWLGLVGSGASGTMNAQSNLKANTGAYSLLVRPNANSRFLAQRGFPMTPKKKLAFEGYFNFDSQVNTRFVHIEATWYDTTNLLQRTAAYRYDTFNQYWNYLPSTSTNDIGPYNVVSNSNVSLASGAQHYFHFIVDFGNNLYNDFLNDEIGVLDQSTISIPTFATTQNDQVILQLGAENTASGAGNIWFDDVRVWEID